MNEMDNQLRQPTGNRRALRVELDTEPWPTNEILMRVLAMSRKTDTEIAEAYRVQIEQVATLRKGYGL